MVVGSIIMRCPVYDGASAEDITAPGFDGKSFRCPQCRDYSISGNLWDTGKWHALDRDERMAALGKARGFAAPGKKPVIDYRCV
jgi:hypothetical protein